MSTYEVCYDLIDERVRQDEKWGEQNHPDGTGPERRIWAPSGPSNAAIAKAARDRCDHDFRQGEGTWEHILTEEYAEALAESDPAKLREELIQVAAVAVA